MTPATCGSRYRGPVNTYDCDLPPGHPDVHATHRDGVKIAGWTDAMSLSVADWAEQASADLHAAFSSGQAAPGPLRDGDLRNQHRATAAFILGRYDRGGIITRGEVAELRRVTDAEQAENDGARILADRWETNALTTADRLDAQAERTRKARRQRDEIAADAASLRKQLEHIAAAPLNSDVWARIGMALGWTPERAGTESRKRRLHGEKTLTDALNAERETAETNRREADHLRRQFADALDEHPTVPWERLVNRAAAYNARTLELSQQLSESETAGHRLLKRAEAAEDRVRALTAQLDTAHRRADAADTTTVQATAAERLITADPANVTAALRETPTVQQAINLAAVREANARADAARLNARAEIAAANQAREQAEHDRDRRRRQVTNRLGLDEDTSWPDLLGNIGSLTYARQRAADAEGGRVAADNMLRAVCTALGTGPDTDPVVKARETLTRALDVEGALDRANARAEKAERAADLLAESHRRAEQAERRATQWEAAARRVIDLCGNQGSDVQDTLRAALDGQDADRIAPCDAYQVPDTSADTGYCARCGMADWKHGRG